jgi:hypothetical protein
LAKRRQRGGVLVEPGEEAGGLAQLGARPGNDTGGEPVLFSLGLQPA